MKVLADEPLLSAFCRLLGAQQSTEDPTDWAEPLLVYAHSHATGVPRWLGGLARLERLLAAAPETAICEVLIVGFLPADFYQKYNYLCTYQNYQQLPLSNPAILHLKYQRTVDEIRKAAQRRYVDPDLMRIDHFLNRASAMKLTTTKLVAELKKMQSELASLPSRLFVSRLIKEIARTTPKRRFKVLTWHRNQLMTIKGRYERNKIDRLS